ncbi:hydrogenase maturation protease [Clostridium sp. ZS2-4]|uniref:hydrogenase maturation protease n=1 Tax=Clostridium sp. ZS2-4 TaxID=2987703 RepID=UPI00227B9EB7|nr:hydrogenase maturation protease [Clostridium sp. ZS2-4]MCY6356240.1 hydrogenase maturation protease [Clostridium sp. ZS2-4]
MSKKLIAIGNRIMSDDGIGVLIAEKLKAELENTGIQVIIGETDVDYCLSLIEDGDLLFILDATLYGIKPGAVSIVELDKTGDFFEKGYSQHQLSLIKLLNSYALKKVSGFVIGIEVSNIEFGIELSEILKENFEKIKNQVYNLTISKGGL